eukprot:scaffold412_cov311-Pavlova_lutheri.AAC.23
MFETFLNLLGVLVPKLHLRVSGDETRDGLTHEGPHLDPATDELEPFVLMQAFQILRFSREPFQVASDVVVAVFRDSNVDRVSVHHGQVLQSALRVETPGDVFLLGIDEYFVVCHVEFQPLPGPVPQLGLFPFGDHGMDLVRFESGRRFDFCREVPGRRHELVVPQEFVRRVEHVLPTCELEHVALPSDPEEYGSQAHHDPDRLSATHDLRIGSHALALFRVVRRLRCAISTAFVLRVGGSPPLPNLGSVGL